MAANDEFLKHQTIFLRHASLPRATTRTSFSYCSSLLFTWNLISVDACLYFFHGKKISHKNTFFEIPHEIYHFLKFLKISMLQLYYSMTLHEGWLLNRGRFQWTQPTSFSSSRISLNFLSILLTSIAFPFSAVARPSNRSSDRKLLVRIDKFPP